ncbi:MAG: DUF421 domain-containing protein [Christensenellales bacterium]
MRLMGKRQIGQLQPFEFVLALIVANLAAIPIASTSIPIFYGIIPVVTLFLLHTAFSYLSMKSDRFRAMLCGKPIIVIERGKILCDELRKLNYNLSDLMEQLRVNNIMDLADVDYAILETNGNLSVLEKKEAQKATVGDLKGGKEYGGLPLPIVKDGKIQHENLNKRNWDKTWIVDQLKGLGILQKDVFVATLDDNGSMYLQTYAGDSISVKLPGKGANKNE